MNSILVVILTSGVVSAFVSSFTNFLLKKIDYRNEYNKYLIEKRKMAYDLLEQIVNQFSERTYISYEGSYIPAYRMLVFRKQEENFWDSLQKKVSQTHFYKLWYSDDLYNKISELNAILFDIHSSYTRSTHESGVFILNNPILDERIKKNIDEISLLLFMEMTALYNLKGLKRNFYTNYRKVS